MALTATLTTWAWWLVAAAVFACSVVWPKTASTNPRGRWGRDHLRRAGMQLAVVATSLLAVAGTLNAQYDWYSSWSDLGSIFGADGSSAGSPAPVAGGLGPTAAAVVAAASTVPSGGGNPSGLEGLEGLKPDPGPSGQYLTVTVPGPVSHTTGTVTVWVPQSYMQAGSAQRHYPVIEVFHGVPGSPLEYAHDIDLGRMVAGLAAAGQMKEAILVMPDSTPGHVDTECVNGGSTGPAMEDWLTQDVPSWVRDHLRVQQDRASWATMGLSTGGFCSLMATMLHPETYGAAIELGGYLAPVFDPHYRPFAPGTAAWNRYDLLKLAATTPPPVQLWIETSKTDTLSFPGNSRLIATASPPMKVTADILQDAGHRMSVWVGVMPTALRWLGSTVDGFKL